MQHFKHSSDSHSAGEGAPSVPRIIINQFKWLDRVVDPKVVVMIRENFSDWFTLDVFLFLDFIYFTLSVTSKTSFKDLFTVHCCVGLVCFRHCRIPIEEIYTNTIMFVISCFS